MKFETERVFANIAAKQLQMESVKVRNRVKFCERSKSIRESEMCMQTFLVILKNARRPNARGPRGH